MGNIMICSVCLLNQCPKGRKTCSNACAKIKQNAGIAAFMRRPPNGKPKRAVIYKG